jgi:hypothetical protein
MSSKTAFQRRRRGPEQQGKVTMRKAYGFRTYGKSGMSTRPALTIELMVQDGNP